MRLRVWVVAIAAAGSVSLGLTAASGEPASSHARAGEPTLYPMPAPPAYPMPCPPPPLPHHKHHGGHRPHKPHGPEVPDSALPSPPALQPHHPDLASISGKGMWLTTWANSKVDVPGVVAAAKAGGLHQLWVRTGGSRQGWYGRPLLERLLPAAHEVGISVVAWDFPTLSDPVADSLRAAAALTGTFGGERLDAFSPDIETRAEGTYNSPERVALYLAHVRLLAGNRPVVATVMRPTPGQLKDYPYRAEAPYVDAFAPMDYWSCHEPGETAEASIRVLAALRPVTPIGQAYDMKWEGGRPGMPTPQEIWRFIDACRRAGAIGASLYDTETATADERHALDAYPWSRADPDRVIATSSSAPSPMPSPMATPLRPTGPEPGPTSIRKVSPSPAQPADGSSH
ncbi:MAG TPA: hypothetical protein VHV82_11325 [Sporichthyaceae bacterium]|nr:hypothetical protein [Sporichthyaceae bacterium]